MQNLTKNNGDKAEEHFIWQWGFFQLIYAPKLSLPPTSQSPWTHHCWLPRNLQLALASTGAHLLESGTQRWSKKAAWCSPPTVQAILSMKLCELKDSSCIIAAIASRKHSISRVVELTAVVVFPGLDKGQSAWKGWGYFYFQRSSMRNYQFNRIIHILCHAAVPLTATWNNGSLWFMKHHLSRNNMQHAAKPSNHGLSQCFQRMKS